MMIHTEHNPLESPKKHNDAVVMQTAMMWGSSQKTSADLLFEEAGMEKTSTIDLINHHPPQEEYLTTSDLPPRISGGDPMHAVTALMNREGSDGSYDEPEWSIKTKEFTIGGASLMSTENMTEYSLPEWVMGEVPVSFPEWEPMCTTPPVYTWCGRATHSDVTCVKNTVQTFRDLSEVLPQSRKKVGSRLPASSNTSPLYATSSSTLSSGNGSMSSARSITSYSPLAGNVRKSDPKKKCRLPYAVNSKNLVTVKASTNTLLAKERALDSRRRMNAQLLAERDEFMQKLNAERSIRLYEETEGAIRIQAAFRGFKSRPHSEAAAAFKKELIQKRKMNRSEPTLECESLKKLDAMLKPKLKYIEGVTLPKLKKTKKQRILEKKQKDVEQRSVVLLQNRARILNAKKCVERLMQRMAEQKHEQAILHVQRVSRGGLIRNSIRKEKENKAAVVLQSTVRYSIRRRRQQSIIITKNELIREQKRQEKASLKIQAVARGRLSRRKSVHRVYAYTSPTTYEYFDSLNSSNEGIIPEGEEFEEKGSSPGTSKQTSASNSRRGSRPGSSSSSTSNHSSRKSPSRPRTPIK